MVLEDFGARSLDRWLSVDPAQRPAGLVPDEFGLGAFLRLALKITRIGFFLAAIVVINPALAGNGLNYFLNSSLSRI